MLTQSKKTDFYQNSDDFVYDLTWPAAISRPFFRTKFLTTQLMGEDLWYFEIA